MTLTERIAALRSLDAKRTPGEWAAMNPDSPSAGISVIHKRREHIILSHSTVLDILSNRWGNGTPIGDDLRFIEALANEALPIITELEAERDRLQWQIDFVKSNPDHLITFDTDGAMWALTVDEAARENARLREAVGVAMEALGSISRNSCCDTCQEAKLVARKALDAMEGL